MEQKLTREELATLEIGRTVVSRPLAVSLVCCFLLFIFAVPLYQRVTESGDTTKISLYNSFAGLFNRNYPETNTLWQRNTELLARMDTFEEEIEKNSFLRDWILVPGQRLLLALGAGNEKVYPGKDGWLFYRPDMDYLMGPGFLDTDTLTKREGEGALWDSSVQPDPLKAIISFHRQLQKRGITLVLMPTPIKASLHPDLFASGSYSGVLQNRSWSRFLLQVKEAGIPLFDPAPILKRFVTETGSPAYLKTDTHWVAAAMEDVAKELAIFLREEFSWQPSDIGLQRQEKQVRNSGDIADMLLIPAAVSPFPPQADIIHPVLTHANELWQPTVNADILLLGDSFANIFSLAGMGWGESAGLAEQLSFYLDRDLDVLLQNDAGSYATREMLAAELLRGRDRLENKKVVVWEFAARELASGNWKIIPMELKATADSDFFVPAANEKRRVSAVVSAVSRSPMPGTVPYKDNIVTLHLVDIKDLTTGEDLGQSLVYGWGMQENVLTDLARLRVGQRIEMNCIDWDSVQMKVSSYRRSSLDDEMLELELPVWGELL